MVRRALRPRIQNTDGQPISSGLYREGVKNDAATNFPGKLVPNRSVIVDGVIEVGTVLTENKNVLITGAGKGIGRAIAEQLAAAGARITVTGHQLDNAEATRDIIQENSGEAVAYEMDVTDAASINRVIEAVEENGYSIDVLVNNAGVSTMTPLLELSEDAWEHNMEVNAKGVFLCSKRIAEHMIENAGNEEITGKIINIASLAGRSGAPNLSHYAASKWAVLGFTQSIALELAEEGITANSVCPGYVQTSMQERELEWEADLTDRTPEEVKQAYIDETPLGRLETPGDVADVVLFLASSKSDFLTGQAINTGGGTRMD